VISWAAVVVPPPPPVVLVVEICAGGTLTVTTLEAVVASCDVACEVGAAVVLEGSIEGGLLKRKRRVLGQLGTRRRE